MNEEEGVDDFVPPPSDKTNTRFPLGQAARKESSGEKGRKEREWHRLRGVRELPFAARLLKSYIDHCGKLQGTQCDSPRP